LLPVQLCQQLAFLFLNWIFLMANSIVGKLLGSYQDYPAKSEGKQENEFLVAVLVRGRLHLRFERAVWMCSEPSAAGTCVFNVQQNLRSITQNVANIAASRAA
jgi:hypothetical protein